MTTTEAALAALDHLYSWIAPGAANRKSYDTLRAFIEGAGEDVERYRWLREKYDHPGVFERVLLSKSSDGNAWVGLTALDAAIDAARAAAKPKGE